MRRVLSFYDNLPLPEKYKTKLKSVIHKIASIIFLFYPWIEINSVFGSKVIMATENMSLKLFWFDKLLPLVTAYEKNIYLWFALMLAGFIGSVYNNIGTTRFVRFNIIQSVLIEIVVTVFTQLFLLTPPFLRESMLGFVLIQSMYMTTHVAIFYCIVHILYGYYPIIPVVTEGARSNLQWFR